MDRTIQTTSKNIFTLSGRVCQAPEFSHESHSNAFYIFPLEICRLSGVCDKLNILIREDLLSRCPIKVGSFVKIGAELRSFNKKTDSGNKLIVFAFVKEIEPSESELFENDLLLTGTVCKTPIYRKTPLGREICDIMLAINRRYGRSDYIPIIAWGKNAKDASAFATGDIVSLRGRVQSREYIKVIDGAEIPRTTYEVSVTSFLQA